MSARRLLALFAKHPRPGLVKTRLHPPLSLEQAADLYAAMLADICDQHVGETQRGGIDAASRVHDRALWFAPAEAQAWFGAHVPGTYRLLAQRGPDLASRMRALFHHHAAEGYDRIVLRGTDSPSLPADRVSAAFSALERSDVVLCPDRDGGYNLIGLRAPHDELFELEMSTASVLDGTLARARESGLEVELLEPHHDVDTWDDLVGLVPELCARRTPHTLRWWEANRDRLPPLPSPGSERGVPARAIGG